MSFVFMIVDKPNEINLYRELSLGRDNSKIGI